MEQNMGQNKIWDRRKYIPAFHSEIMARYSNALLCAFRSGK